MDRTFSANNSRILIGRADAILCWLLPVNIFNGNKNKFEINPTLHKCMTIPNFYLKRKFEMTFLWIIYLDELRH